MKRRNFLKLSSLATLGSILSCREGLVNPEKPNVLFITLDDLNDWIGCLGGHPDVKTPNLDKLAAQGRLFSNAHCPAPVCYPSRTSLVTGLYPSSSGIYLHRSPAFRTLLPNIKTIPQHFMAHGYYTVCGGKVFHGQEKQSWHESTPFKRLPFQNPKYSGIEDTYKKDVTFDWGAIDLPESQTPAWQLTDWAIQALQKSYAKPLFLGVGFNEPHMPWYIPRKYFEQYSPEKVTLPLVKADDLADVPAFGKNMAFAHLGLVTPQHKSDHQRVLNKNLWRSAVVAFLAAITFVDRMIGRLLEALDNSAYANNTIVVLLSDHGFHLGEKGHWRKDSLWEEATRVPLIIKTPTLSQAGQACHRPVSLVDIYPTLCELCGIPFPQHTFDGHSLLPLLENPKAQWQSVALTTYGGGNHGIRSEHLRYIRYHDGGEELYDHRTDPNEWYNLASHPEYASELAKLKHHLPTQAKPDQWCLGHRDTYAPCYQLPR